MNFHGFSVALDFHFWRQLCLSSELLQNCLQHVFTTYLRAYSLHGNTRAGPILALPRKTSSAV